MSTKKDQIGAIQAVANNLGISQVFNAKAYHLFHALNLINIYKKDITCLGICKDGGTCQRHIAKQDAITGLFGLTQVVFDPEIHGEELKERLEAVFLHLLCTQQHKAQFEAKACVTRHIDVVEEVRKTYRVDTTQPRSTLDSVVRFIVALRRDPSLRALFWELCGLLIKRRLAKFLLDETKRS